MKLISFLLFLCITLPLFAQKQTEMTIHFDFNKAVIRPTDSRLLDSLIATFPVNSKNASIEIYGHTDSKGTNGYNDTLSLKRVKAAKKYLLARGVALSSITREEGYGSQRPVATVRNSSYEIINRRVELVITTNEEVTTSEKTLTKIIEDTATRSGTNIILKNLNFIGGTHHLLNSSLPILQDLLNVLQANKNLVIQIEGHICCLRGDQDGYDDDLGTKNLSEERAKAVYTYLVNNHIAAERLSYKGYGHKRPIFPYPEKTKQQEMLNRRVEIKIIKK
jgi:outer membrane protein OmpA-like peptidoglycan-associated protein